MSEFLDQYTRTSKLLRALADTGMRRLGLHLGQNHLLAELWREDGRTPGELAAALNVTTPTIVKAATRMTATGLLTRRRDDVDNRLVRLWLTDAGRALQEPVEAERADFEETILAGLSADDRVRLVAALAILERNAARVHGGPVESD